jgi:hypothetical protein
MFCLFTVSWWLSRDWSLPGYPSELLPVRKHSQITAGLIPHSLPRNELFPDRLESVIPECFYRESRRNRNWTPIKTFGGDALWGKFSSPCSDTRLGCCRIVQLHQKFLAASLARNDNPHHLSSMRAVINQRSTAASRAMLILAVPES